MKAHRVPCLALLTAAVLAAITPAATAQTPVLTQLGKPQFQYPEGFSNVGFIRELPDRRVVVIDSKERLLIIVDTTGKQSQIGRSGRGPGEYLAPIGLYALPGDSTLVYDILNSRALLLDRSGKPVGIDRIFTLDGAVERPLRQTAPSFGDREGRLYARGYPINNYQSGDDSAALVRYDRRQRRADTLGFLRLPALVTVSTLAADGSTSSSRGVNPFTARDGWAAGHDGRVAIVHASPYRVEWIQSDRSRMMGPVVSYAQVPLSAADKAFVTDPKNQKRSGGTGPGSDGLPDRMPAPQFTSWPDDKPAFVAESPRLAPDGSLWVERSRSFADSVRTYDVFDERGALTERVALPAGTRLAGFGEAAVYLVRVDADDLEHLERYGRRFAASRP
jgi:hypothetical protein